MYARRYDAGMKAKPAGMTAAIAINAGVIALLLSAAPPEIVRDIETILTVDNIPINPPPPPEPFEKRIERVEPRPTIAAAPTPIIDLPRPPINDLRAIDDVPILPPLPFPPIGGTGTAIDPAPTAETALPAIVGAAVDARFARDFQPSYPAAERRAGTEGIVRVRVLIGVDGRVLQVERLAAASDGLFEATRRQALAKWRFRPATRSDIPVESWKVMTVRFELSAA